MRLDHATGADLLERLIDAYRRFDGDDVVACLTRDVEVARDPFEPPLVGHEAVRRMLLEAAEVQEQVEFTVERHWVVAPTILAAWHAGYVHRATRARVRSAGFLTLDVTADGLIDRARAWSVRRESTG